MKSPTLLQIQFLKEFITMEPKKIPYSGPFANVGIFPEWFTIDGDIFTITRHGITVFWDGVSVYGAKEVMKKPVIPRPDNGPKGAA